MKESTMTLAEAQKIADEIMATLTPFCLRIEIAGSIRRQKPENIKDVEVVLIPSPYCLSKLADIINNRWGRPSIGKWPSKYTRIRSVYNIDIFTATLDNWAMILFI